MITKEVIVNTVCEACGITAEELRSGSRRRKISDARKISAYLLLDYGLCHRMAEIGREIGVCRNSVYKVLSCFDTLRTYDSVFRSRFDYIADRLCSNEPQIDQ